MNHLEMCSALKSGFGESAVELWHTGGGIMNPVLVWKRNADGSVCDYLLFSDGWYPDEAAFGFCEQGEDDDTRQYWSGDGSAPMEPLAFVAFVRAKLVAWGLCDDRSAFAS